MIQSRPVLLGQYRPLDSFLHLLDARAKLLPVTLVLVLALFTNSSLFYLAMLSTLVAGLLLSGISERTLLTNFKPVAILVLITLLYHLLFSAHDSEALVSILGLDISRYALRQGLFYSLRLVLFVSVAFLVTLTSSPSELADAFAKLLRPLERLRLPIQDLALIMFLAIRFIPVLYDEFTTIRHAQMVRGVRFSGSTVTRLRRSLSIIIPVFVAALQRADDLAHAIQARGYGQSSRRTFYSQSHLGMREWLFMVGSTVGIALLFHLLR